MTNLATFASAQRLAAMLALIMMLGCGSGVTEPERDGGGGGGGGGGGEGGGGGGGSGSGGIPTNAIYRVRVEGEGSFSGSPSGVPWVLEADLVIVPTVDPNSAQFTNNGVNPVDVGLFTLASPMVGQAGALYFGTSTSLSELVGSNLGASAIDIAFVEANAGAGTILITLDGNVFGLPNARLGTFNIYNLTSGVTAQVHNVLAGTMAIQLANAGRDISGTISLGGSSGFTGPAVTSGYTARFAGSRRN